MSTSNRIVAFTTVHTLIMKDLTLSWVVQNMKKDVCTGMEVLPFESIKHILVAGVHNVIYDNVHVRIHIFGSLGPGIIPTSNMDPAFILM